MPLFDALQGRDALDALTVRAARALDKTLSPSRALGGEGPSRALGGEGGSDYREWTEHSLYTIVSRSVFAATVDAIFGASVATDEAYRAFKVAALPPPSHLPHSRLPRSLPPPISRIRSPELTLCPFRARV